MLVQKKLIDKTNNGENVHQVLKELIGNKTVEKIVKPKPAIDENFIKWFNCVKVCEKIKVNDLVGAQYSADKNIRFKTYMLKSDLCDYSDAYIVAKRTITVEGTSDTNKRNKKIIFKNSAPFTLYISKINKTLVDNTKYFHIVMPMCNLLEYSNNYSMTLGNLWNYYWDAVSDATTKTNDANFKTNNNKTTKSISFEYKIKIIGRTPDDDNILDTEVVAPLKYLSKFRRFLDLSLINCETELDLRWSVFCINSEVSITAALFLGGQHQPLVH